MAKSSSSSSSSTSRAAQPQPKSKPATKRISKARTPAQKLKKQQREAAAKARGEPDRTPEKRRQKLDDMKERYHKLHPEASYNRPTKCSRRERLDDYYRCRYDLKVARKQARDAQRECEAKEQLFREFKSFMRSGGSICATKVDQFLALKGLSLS